MIRVLITGSNGQIGWELCRTLAPLGQIAAFDRDALDLADLDRLRGVLREIRPQLIVNGAAYTAVDRAEADAAMAERINADAPRAMAEEASRLGAWLIHYSTDYVFDGSKAGPYVEHDVANPISVYGRTKLAGEQAIAETHAKHLIFRTSWLYANRGRNFLRTMLARAGQSGALRIVADQTGAPTWARLVAEATALCASRVLEDRVLVPDRSGVFHLTCAGQTHWHGFAQAIFARAGIEAPALEPIASADYPAAARRPANSVLSNERLHRAFGIALPDWHDALALCLQG